MEFTHALESLRASGDGTVTVTPDWAQGRALFGGLAGALVLDAMASQIPADRSLRCVSLSFVGPVGPGEVELDARVLRAGGSVSHCPAEAIQDGKVCTAALASFGVDRTSKVIMPAEAAPDVDPPEALDVMPFYEGISPRFTRHFDYCYGIGSLPFSGATTRDMGGWVRFSEDRGAITPMHLLGLIDAWPPATLPLLTDRAPSSSLTWYVEFLQPLPDIQPGDWLLYKATLDHALGGYGQTQARLWTRDGELLAISRQTVTVFG